MVFTRQNPAPSVLRPPLSMTHRGPACWWRSRLTHVILDQGCRTLFWRDLDEHPQLWAPRAPHTSCLWWTQP